MTKKIYLFSAIFYLAAFGPVAAQKKVVYVYKDAQELTKNGQWPLNTTDYQRIDTMGRVPLPAAVQVISHFSSGINILFQTDSKSIAVKWRLSKYRVLGNMTPVGANGIDLYGWNGTNWQYVGIGIPKDEDNSAIIITGLLGKMTHYRMYLPLNTEATHVEIGVEQSATITPADQSFTPKKRVVVYGSSITQGTAASRPGMVYTSILSRRLGVEVINLGFGGSGKMEIPLVDVIAKIPADVYILDCVPNPTPAQIKERAYPFIKKLHALKPNTPIIMMESITREKAFWDQVAKVKVAQQNAEFKTAYNQLIKDGEKQLYYLPSNTLNGNDHEATVDGTHLTDLGFMRIADTVEKTLQNLLK